MPSTKTQQPRKEYIVEIFPLVLPSAINAGRRMVCLTGHMKLYKMLSRTNYAVIFLILEKSTAQ